LALPALAVAQTALRKGGMASATFRYEELPVRKGSASVTRQILKGDTHTAYTIDLHETELPAGETPHAPHHHIHEEMVLIREGTLEVTIAGRNARLGPGSVAYVASNEEHGWRNAGTTVARYFVLALGNDQG
jgi:quercetin dioxygenase-like cupin family protein